MNLRFESLIQLKKMNEDEDYYDYMEDIRITALKLIHEMYAKGKEDSKPKVEKIPTYTIIRKEKYPYIIIRTKNYDQAFEESRIKYPNIKEVYKVNYDDEEAYSSTRLIREFGNIEIRNDELLFKNYAEKKFLDDLESFSSTHQNGCRTFALLRKDDHDFPYYGLWVNQVNYNKSKAKLQRIYPNLVELYQLAGMPDAEQLHFQIKYTLVENIASRSNHIKLLSNFTEDEFIEQVEKIGKAIQRFISQFYPTRELVESRFNT